MQQPISFYKNSIVDRDLLDAWKKLSLFQSVGVSQVVSRTAVQLHYTNICRSGSSSDGRERAEFCVNSRRDSLCLHECGTID